MELFADRRIKLFFRNILLCILSFIVISVSVLMFEAGRAPLYIMFSTLCMNSVILYCCYSYFMEQHKIMQKAILQIKKYISGNKEITLDCNEEGELHRLFHEVNSLVSVLNAHADNEKKAKKFLKNTMSDISHQLKTPLAALNVYNGIMKEEAKNPATIQAFCQLSEQELDRIESLVENLLKITKIDAGMIILEKSLENINKIAEYIKDYYLFRANQEGKKIYLSGDADITFYCDRSWIEEAISNLVKNALDHTEKGDFIRIEWRAFASVIQITIKDNGSGIYPEDLHHIFKRFYRSRFTKDTQGIGLGLPLAKAIVEAHNGTIEVDSIPGGETAFIISFLIPTKL